MLGKTALITGASSDIGHAIAKALAASGYHLAVHCHHNVTAIQAIHTEAAKVGVQAECFRYDLTEATGAEALVNSALKTFGRLDVLVNTIGPFYFKDIGEVTPAEWAEAIQLNLHVAFNVTYFAKPHLCSSQGHIINFAFSGVEHLKAWPRSTAYGAAKAGIVVLTKALAGSLAPRGVRVNAICPGLIEVGESSAPEREEMARQIPLGRPGKPDEIADVLTWLVTESPSYVTGALIPVAGAWEY